MLYAIYDTEKTVGIEDTTYNPNTYWAKGLTL